MAEKTEVSEELLKMIRNAGLSPSPAVLSLCGNLIRKCIEICNDAGEDIENGNIFDKETQLAANLQANHAGCACWYASREIAELLRLESLPAV